MTIDNIHRKISVNLLANLARYVVYVVVTFVMTPYIVKMLGLEDYGTWVLVLAVVGYGGLLEMGVQTSVVKLVSQKSAVNDLDGINCIISTAYVFFQCVGLFIALFLIFIAPLFVSAFVAVADNQQTVRLLFMILGINTGFCFSAYLFGGIIYGMQRYSGKSAIDIVLAVINAGLTFFVLEQDRGIIGLAVVKAVVDFFSMLSLFFLARRILPSLKIRVSEVSFSAFSELFNLGGKVFISSTTTRIANCTESVIISGIMSNAWLAVFSVPKRLVEYVKEISFTATTGFMPMFSELDVRENLEYISDIYERYTRYVFMVVIPFVASIFVLGVPFIRLWIGEEMAKKCGNISYYLSVAFLIESMQPLVWRLMIGVGRVNYLVFLSAICSMAYLGISALCVFLYGIDGICVALIAVTLINQAFSFPYVCKFLGVSPVKHFLKCQFWPIIGCFLLVFLIDFFVGVFGDNSYVKLIFISSISFVCYGIYCYNIVLSCHERSCLKNKFAF